MKKLINLFKLSVLLYTFIVSFNNCKGQTNDTIKNKPQINYQVNKEYDNNGNIIRYDSTYSYIYTSPGNSFSFNNSIIFNDSLFNNSLMFPDSLFNNNIFNYLNNPDLQYNFNEDIFDKQFKEQMKEFEDMLKQLHNMQKGNINPDSSNIDNNKKNNKPNYKVITL